MDGMNGMRNHHRRPERAVRGGEDAHPLGDGDVGRSAGRTLLHELIRKAADRAASPERSSKQARHREFLSELAALQREPIDRRGRLAEAAPMLITRSRRTFERMLARFNRDFGCGWTRYAPRAAGRTTATIAMLPPQPRRHVPGSHRTHFSPRRTVR